MNSSARRRFCIVITVLLLAGCARLPMQRQYEATLPPKERGTPCRQFFNILDKAVARAEVTDGQAAPIPAFPYLRIDRFLASFRDEVVQERTFMAWVDRLQRLAEQGRKMELRNLPADEIAMLRRSLPPTISNERTLIETVTHCGEQLRSHDLANTATRVQLRKVVRVPAEYVTWQRGVGIYFITANAAKAGISKWHKKTHKVYAQPFDASPIHGELVRYVPPPQPEPLSAEAIREILQQSAHNPLGIPEPGHEDRERLFAVFAPIFQTDVVSDDDRIGAPAWSGLDVQKPWVDIQRPVVYRHLSHTRFGGEVLLQLNYIVWFPSRPRTSRFDYLGGHIDGIMWRVTLSRDGTPLLFDSTHNCGCYHMFFPTRGLRLRPIPNTPDDDHQEPALVPQRAPVVTTGAGPTLRIAHRTHYIERVTTDPIDQGRVVTYRWADYDTLRSLPVAGGGHRSLFRPDGIIPGTKRRERWFLWPLGVPHPGEMRQWGHHATAFVGRRHFDDAYLLENLFELSALGGANAAAR